MKTHFSHRPGTDGGQRGITLIECLVYVGVVTVVLGVGTMAFYRCWDANKAMRRNAEDIVRALHAGEQWRADVRAAIGPIVSDASAGNEFLLVPQRQGQVVYTLVNGELHRQARSGAPDVVLLPKVKSSRMQAERREHVTVWRWELELEPSQKKARLRPLFSFETVPGTPATR